jgi:guanosine-3',5'-bis(diphosphate) 3'-pyrophosphohydrolase
MSNLATAIAIAAKGFEFIKDKSGEPYIMHCIRVMMNLNTTDNERKIIAILHDCIEDKVCTIEDLFKQGFSQRVISALMLLTHDKEKDTYDEYIKKIATNIDATEIKKSDLQDNSNIMRLKGLTKKDFDRMEKYHRSYVYLSKL